MNLDKIYNDIVNENLSEDIQEENIKIIANDDSYNNNMFIRKGKKDWGWQYQAKVLALRGYPKVNDVIPELFEWLQDMNWPGANEISQLISTFPRNVLVQHFEDAVAKAINQKDYQWLEFLYEFAKKNNLSKSSFNNEKLYNIMESYYFSLE